MDIAICGIRGIPACYGGFETFAEELSTRLFQRGHRVLVYGRSHVIRHTESKYCGVDLKLLPAPRHKYLETPVHTLLCLAHMQFHRPQVVLVCNAANSPFIWINRLTGIPTAVNVDGIERKRAKWNKLGKAWYRLGEYASVWFANRVIADAEVIKEYYLSEHGCNSVVIPYGYTKTAKAEAKASGLTVNFEAEELTHFEELGIQPNRYLLDVGRLEPENNAHVVVDAYNRLSPDHKRFPLLIVGDAPYASDYIQSLKEKAGHNIIFAGYRFSAAYRTLQLGAYLYIQASEVGGTHPALVEALGFANCVIANNTPENIEVVAGAGLSYERNSPVDLSYQLTRLIDQPEVVASFRNKAFQHAELKYSWDRVTDSYEQLFYNMIGKRKPSDHGIAVTD